MTKAVFLLAAAGAFDPLKEAAQGDGFNRRDVLIAVSVGVGIGVLLFIWAYFRYRKTDDDEGGHDSSEPAEPAENGDSGRRRRRKRRRRREHRPRNPSLQQTGGLPPPRPDDQLPRE
jgi:hypothetical protein